MAPSRQRSFVPFALAASALLVAFVLALGAASARADSPSSGSLLFVQQTDGGSLVHTDSGNWKLRLEGVSPAVSTFTDRPDRVAGRQGLRRFVGAWAKNGFAADPPNAALVIDGAPAASDVAMLTLSNPHYDRRRRLLVYRVKPLHGDAGGDLDRLQKRGDPLRAGEFESAGLFIDSSGVETKSEPMFLSLGGVNPGRPIAIELSGDGIEFSSSTTSGVSLDSYDGPLSLSRLTVQPHRLIVSVPGSEGEFFGLQLSLGLVADADVQSFFLNLGDYLGAQANAVQANVRLGSSGELLRIQTVPTLLGWSGQ